MNRRKFILIYLPAMFILGMVIFFGLKIYSKKNFSVEKFKTLTETVSTSKDKTDDFCKYQILSEPKVGDRYVKVNFWCSRDKRARSTLSLDAIADNSVDGILHKYARIINFDYRLIQDNHWYCLLNDQEINSSNLSQIVNPASTIDCFPDKNLSSYAQK
jgi:hypothetical protein